MEALRKVMLVLLTAGLLLGAAGCDTEGPVEGEEIED